MLKNKLVKEVSRPRRDSKLRLNVSRLSIVQIPNKPRIRKKAKDDCDVNV